MRCHTCQTAFIHCPCCGAMLGPDPIPERIRRTPDSRRSAVIFAAICERVARAWGLKETDILSKRRDRHLVEARAKIAIEMRKAGLTVVETGRYLNRDHSTIVHLLQTYEHVGGYAPLLADLWATCVEGVGRSNGEGSEADSSTVAHNQLLVDSDRISKRGNGL